MSQIAKRDASSSRIPELDGLRGAAILAVLLFHCVAYVPGGQPGSSLARFQRLFSMGWAGVDLFFVLSGFLIGGILLGARSSSSYFGPFYLRRFFRIIPLYYTWILGYVLVVAVAGKILGNLDATASQAPLSVARQFLFLGNYTFGPYPAFAIAWLGPTWSLAVEEQFYLVSPLLVRYLTTRILSIVLLSAVLAAPLIRLYVRSHMPGGYFFAYMLTVCRMDALALGMLTAIVWRDSAKRQWISSHVGILNGLCGVMFIGVLVLWLRSTDQYGVIMQSVGFTWIASFFVTLLLVVLTQPTGLIAWAARLGWLRELGKVSYCMYLIHQAVNLFTHFLLLRSTPQIQSWPGVLTTMLAGMLTYAIAKVSWIMFENPLLRFGHRFRYAQTLGVDQSIERNAGISDRPEMAT